MLTIVTNITFTISSAAERFCSRFRRCVSFAYLLDRFVTLLQFNVKKLFSNRNNLTIGFLLDVKRLIFSNRNRLSICARKQFDGSTSSKDRKSLKSF